MKTASHRAAVGEVIEREVESTLAYGLVCPNRSTLRYQRKRPNDTTVATTDRTGCGTVFGPKPASTSSVHTIQNNKDAL